MVAHSLGVSSRARWRLRGVSVTLRPGEVLAVVGPNGAGKSTLLRCFAGALPPDEGAVTLDGIALKQWAPDALARRRAVLSQHSATPPGWTCADVVSLGRTPHGDARASTGTDAVMRALDRVDLHGCAARTLSTLSGGQQQRVHLARLLAQLDGPRGVTRFALLDEPSTHLDVAQQHRTMRLARDLAHEGVGVLAVLHELPLAARYADRVLLLSQGTFEALGRPRDVLDAPRLSRVWGVRFVVPWLAGAAHPVALPHDEEEGTL